ncbi:hypothetical protein CFRS1_v012171 [Colletotrichum fructicola]|nr:hypothetical protein CFRS1_v012171 [Colletotrichum fructicola]
MQFSALLATIAGLAVGVSSAALNVRGEDVGCVGACGHDYVCISQCFDKRGLETRRSAAQQLRHAVTLQHSSTAAGRTQHKWHQLPKLLKMYAQYY